MLLWIFLILCCSVRADLYVGLHIMYNVYTSFPLTNRSFPSGQSVAYAGEVVKMTCYDRFDTGNVTWYRWNERERYYMGETDSNLLFFKTTVEEDSGEYMCSTGPITGRQNATVTLTVVEKLSPLRVLATPVDPIVVEGHGVTLHCNASSVPSSVTWAWHRMEHLGGWQEVGTERDLTLTKAGESGQYRCHALSLVGIRQERLSPNHTVVIISIPTTARENLGVAAFVLCLLGLILFSAILLRLGWQRAKDRVPLDAPADADAPAKSSAGPAKAPKGGLPESGGEADADVYINYTSTNQAYSDLDPTYMPGEDVYSTLS